MEAIIKNPGEITCEDMRKAVLNGTYQELKQRYDYWRKQEREKDKILYLKACNKIKYQIFKEENDAYTAEWRRRNPQKQREYTRRSNIKKREFRFECWAVLQMLPHSLEDYNTKAKTI